MLREIANIMLAHRTRPVAAMGGAGGKPKPRGKRQRGRRTDLNYSCDPEAFTFGVVLAARPPASRGKSAQKRPPIRAALFV